MHRFAMGVLCAALCLSMSLVSGSASAAKKVRGPCIIVQQPVCLPLWYPQCTRKTSCGGCLKWACAPIFAPR
jgi:hypothetical protein